ncbi:MAG: tyrosine-type recombinase/integrase [Nitrosopumilaceae archaeon]
MQRLQLKNSSYTNFENAIKSKETLRVYKHSLDEFLIFTKAKSLDSIINYPTSKIQQILKDWVINLKSKKLKASTIRPKLAAVELFLDMNEVVYFKRIIHKMIPSDDEKQGGDVSYTNEDINRMLEVSSKNRTRALIHFLASTGARPSGIIDPVLKVKHLEDMPDGCKAVKIYDESKQGYYAFLTPEASKALKLYFDSRKTNGEKLNNESPVFASIIDTNKAKLKYDYLTRNNLYVTLSNVIKKAGIQRIKKGKRYDKALSYGFRKRFNTILKLNNDVNSNIAEKLMAHKRGLDSSYLTPTRDECFAEFSKAIPQLTIDQSERLKVEKESLKKELSDKEKLVQKVKDLEENMNMMQDKMQLLEGEKEDNWEENRMEMVKDELRSDEGR